MWRPESYWHVKSTGKREMDVRLGRRYARQAVSAIKADHNTQLIVLIVQDMIQNARKRRDTKGHSLDNAVLRGFLTEIGEIIAALP